MRKLGALSTMAALLVLAACTSPVGPQNSGIATPSLWHEVSDGQPDLTVPLAVQDESPVDQAWWRHFDDPTLTALIGEALTGSKTLAIAKARVEEARAGRLSAQSALLPQINGEASSQRGNQGYATLNQTVNISQVDVAATWELDLFGRNQARLAQARAILQSAQASQQAVRVGLLAELARTYFDLRNDARQIDIARANLATQKRTLELIEAQKQGALASDFDVQRAGAQVSATEALIPALQSAYDAAHHRLNVLLGRPPGDATPLPPVSAGWQPLDSHIVIAAPAKVLAARPDVRVAERQFAASIAGTKAAKAEIFPDISLTALFGAQSATPLSSTPWGIGANLVQPLLNFGRIQAQIDTARAQQKEAFLNYQQTVLTALENMENALSAYIHETARNASLSVGVAQNRRAADLAQAQYTNGYTGLLDVLVAQRDLLGAEADRAASDAALRKDLVDIYTAAGGGWADDKTK